MSCHCRHFSEAPTLAMLRQLLRDARSLPSTNAACREPKTRLLRTIQAYTGSWKGVRLFPDSLVVGRNIDGAETPLFWVFQEEFEFMQLAKHLGPNRPVYGMRSCVGIVNVKDHSIDMIDTVCNRYLSGDSRAASEQAIHCRRKLSGRHICISASQKNEPDRARAFASGFVGVDLFLWPLRRTCLAALRRTE